jgi:hypothetical protein
MTGFSNRPSTDASDDDADLVRLLRLASPRPAVDPDRAARVHLAVRGAWRQAVQRRRRRRMAWWASAAALALISTMAGWMLRNAPSPASAAVVLAVSGLGAVTWAPGGESDEPLAIGHAVRAGSAVVTGATSRVTLSLVNRPGQVRLDVDTRVRVERDGTITLERGRLYADSGSDGSVGHALEIRTPRGVVRDVGTRFEVYLTNAALRVRVRAGAASVERARDTRTVPAGMELTVTDRGIAQRAFAGDDPEWIWTIRAAPPFALEGQTLGAFLDWVSIEGGWPVRFADPRRGREARGAVLHGSIDGLTPAEALEVVLPTCGLTHRFEGDAVILDASPDAPGGDR